MEEPAKENHSFELSKNQLENIPEEITTDLALRRGDTSKVSPDELNGLAKLIQTHLLDINNMHRSFNKEFGKVCNTLEALDKDYIQTMLIAMKSGEKAKEEAIVAQGDIEKSMVVQKQTIKALTQFKEKIDKYRNLAEIDSKKDKAAYSYNKLIILEKTVEGLITRINDQSQQLKSNDELIKRVYSQQHFFGMDALRNDLGETRNQLSELRTQLSELRTQVEQLSTSRKYQAKEIKELKDEKEKLENNVHLKDVDLIYDDVQIFKNEAKTLKDTIANQDKVIANLQNNLQALQDKSDEIESKLSNKIIIAYLLAGGSLAIVVIEFIFTIMLINR